MADCNLASSHAVVSDQLFTESVAILRTRGVQRTATKHPGQIRTCILDY